MRGSKACKRSSSSCARKNTRSSKSGIARRTRASPRKLRRFRSRDKASVSPLRAPNTLRSTTTRLHGTARTPPRLQPPPCLLQRYASVAPCSLTRSRSRSCACTDFSGEKRPRTSSIHRPRRCASLRSCVNLVVGMRLRGGNTLCWDRIELGLDAARHAVDTWVVRAGSAFRLCVLRWRVGERGWRGLRLAARARDSVSLCIK
ncbi:uncharacterized protein K452DRAFT_22917 [Aplosporella prunicola CBS 121167]|uniref:Uncharacterized protein n=1 Tax=Aplosporella prunicola CBS 121167 TaxID=1176127 RepID=A0A6A6ATT5_9PEZI|nr:uncharacterized protein K452DRAFT_22917 [Aplosporella prunicola CBS 121167]KAF2135422.1 hypothetical protein K452DRAFT_22917 [Aplosporella prunicola CBS 121167]